MTRRQGLLGISLEDAGGYRGAGKSRRVCNEMWDKGGYGGGSGLYATRNFSVVWEVYEQVV